MAVGSHWALNSLLVHNRTPLKRQVTPVSLGLTIVAYAVSIAIGSIYFQHTVFVSKL